MTVQRFYSSMDGLTTVIVDKGLSVGIRTPIFTAAARKDAGAAQRLEVASANRHDMKLVAATPAQRICARLDDDRTIRLRLDPGYDYEEVRHIVRLAGFEPVIQGRKNKKQRGARAHRWVVERTHSWLNRFRRLWCDRRSAKIPTGPYRNSLAVSRSSSLGEQSYRTGG